MGRVVVVRAEPEATSRQALDYFVGVSAATCGAGGLSMSLVVVPPGAAAERHYHDGYETAIYQLEGQVETRFGDGLRESVVTGPGDFLFIAAGVPHQPVNLSATERAAAIVARNDANEAERVIPYDPAAAGRARGSARPGSG